MNTKPAKPSGGSRGMKKTTPSPGNARQRSQAETRQRLVMAAAALFAEYGSHKTTIAMAAREAGVAAGTVYLHFPDKEALLREVMQVALGELKHSLAKVTATGTARTRDDDVRRRTEGLVHFADENRNLAAVLFDQGHLATNAGAEVLDFLVASQIGGLTDGQKKGWLRTDLDVELAARALVGSLILVLGWWVKRGAGEGPPPGRHEVATQLAELRLYGTGAR
jgi:AcrR family transcriptional regulator